MTALESVTRARVENMLAAIVGPVTTDQDGDFVIQGTNTRTYVRVVRQENLVLIRLFSWPNADVPRSPELYRWVATHPAGFGRISIVERDGTEEVDILVSHDLLGNTLDTDELGMALAGVNDVAEHSASEVSERFGGRMVFEDPNGTSERAALS
jgi:hypothetical protein